MTIWRTREGATRAAPVLVSIVVGPKNISAPKAAASNLVVIFGVGYCVRRSCSCLRFERPFA
jgi:hypothetical protein